MNKYQLRDKAFREIFNIISADSQKLEFTTLETNKKMNSYYIKYGYSGGRSILIVIRNNGDIEYWIRTKEDFMTTHTIYFEPTTKILEQLDDEFFITLKEHFTKLVESITN